MSAVPGAAVTVGPAQRVVGEITVPGDKSISHRYAMLAAVAAGRSAIRNYATGADGAATLACLERLGVEIARQPAPGGGSDVIVGGRGVGGLGQPATTLDAQNSGTTLRLLTGLLAAHPFRSTITGDQSLRRRPMRRVIAPLERMGARISAEDGRPPLTIEGTALSGIDYVPEVPSAQVKSAILLAGLHAEGRTVVRERVVTRDHTERALRAFGVSIHIAAGAIAIERADSLRPLTLEVPGDMSSAAFWAVAAAALPGSDLTIRHVGLNPTRIAILDALARFGARVDTDVESDAANEPRGRVRVRHDTLRDVEIHAEEVPALIDELPVLAALATRGGSITVRGAGELRVKESDRIAALVAGLRALGATAYEWEDGFRVEARQRLSGGSADAAGDHRLAMAFAVAALGATGPSIIHGGDAVAVSYPGFFDVLGAVCR